ncbi:MAG: hypothetical protein LBS77_07365 [Desulfovibrio sp.]|jgi:hypothetical protein|nr:hypothetical protein [Desulfovibrio sp.]
MMVLRPAVELALEVKFVIGRMWAAQSVHFCKYIFEEAHRSGIVGIRK